MREYFGARDIKVTSTTAETHSLPHVAFQNGTMAVSVALATDDSEGTYNWAVASRLLRVFDQGQQEAPCLRMEERKRVGDRWREPATQLISIYNVALETLNKPANNQ